MNDFVLHPEAYSDVDEIWEYIAADRRIVTLTRTLKQFPSSGRKVPEFNDDSVRELIAYSYRIIYRTSDAEVVIAAVIHGKRDLANQ
jgi:toxin ParE1/3/4